MKELIFKWEIYSLQINQAFEVKLEYTLCSSMNAVHLLYARYCFQTMCTSCKQDTHRALQSSVRSLIRVPRSQNLSWLSSNSDKRFRFNKPLVAAQCTVPRETSKRLTENQGVNSVSARCCNGFFFFHILHESASLNALKITNFESIKHFWL